jgi:hypothetical protein
VPSVLQTVFELIAAKLAAVHQRHIRRLIVNLPPRRLKSHLASIAFPAWCLSHDPSAQILCVTPRVLNGDALLAVSQLCTTRSNSSGRSFGA